MPAAGDRAGPIVAKPSWPSGLPKLLFGSLVAAALLPTLSRLRIFAPSLVGDAARIGSVMLAAFCVGSVAGPFVQRRLAVASDDRLALLSGILLVIASAVLVTFGGNVLVRAIAVALHGTGLDWPSSASTSGPVSRASRCMTWHRAGVATAWWRAR